MSLTPLQAAQAAVDAAAAALGPGAPERRGVVLSAPALDCEMLIAHIGGLEARASVGEESAPLSDFESLTTLATILVTYLGDCTPVVDGIGGAIPDIAALEAVAASIGGGAWAVWNALADLDFGCRARRLGPALPINEQGGLAGWQITLVVEVDGAG